jgi:hypothetical protein
MRLIPDHLSDSYHQLVVLAPAGRQIPPAFRNVISDPEKHASILGEMQKMRGGIYLRDGAIRPWNLTPDGRHFQAADNHSWHLLTLDRDNRVSASVRYHEHENTVSFDQLGLRYSALAKDPEWGTRLKGSVESELAAARTQSLAYAEVGGWAVADERRCTTEALRTALATYGLAQLLGGCIGVTMATVRNCSSSILRRIGGRLLEDRGITFPKYFDPQYDCEMEILRFASYAMNPRYQGWVDQIRNSLLTVPLLCPSAVGAPPDFSDSLGYSEALAEAR